MAAYAERYAIAPETTQPWTKTQNAPPDRQLRYSGPGRPGSGFSHTDAGCRNVQPFNSAKFAAAQAANRPILLKFVAADCPICARQEPFLTEMENGPELTDLIVFTVDIDKDADVVHRFNVQQEGTLIVFHGKTERARSTGDTNPTSLKVLMLSGNAS